MFQKIVLSVFVVFVSLLVTFFLLIKVTDFNEYKPKIQKTLKETTGYDISIKGDITLSLSPIGVRIFDVEVRNASSKSSDVLAKLGVLDIALEIAPLLRQEVKVRHLALENLDITIEKNKDGKYNFELLGHKANGDKNSKDINTSGGVKEDCFAWVDIKNIKFVDANVVFKDANTGTQIGAEKIDVEMEDILLDRTKHSKMQGLYFRGDMFIDKLSIDKHNLYGISMNLEMKDALLMMDNLKYTLFDSLFQGSGKVDISGKIPRISLKHKVQELNLDRVTEAFFGKEFLNGQANAELKIACSLADAATMKSTMSGFVHLRGEGVNVLGYDIDSVASALNEPSNPEALFRLFSHSIQENKTSQTLLKELVFKIEMGYSEVKFNDVALSTDKNRLALKGALNILEEKLLDVKVAFLNAKGCATFEQTIIGTFKKPKLKIDESTLHAVTEAALALLGKSKKSSQMVAKKEDTCSPFYAGDVKHPILD